MYTGRTWLIAYRQQPAGGLCVVLRYQRRCKLNTKHTHGHGHTTHGAHSTQATTAKGPRAEGPPKPTNISMSVFPRFFWFYVLCFIAVSGFSQRWEFKRHNKKCFTKRSCRKVLSFNQKIDKKPKTDFFSNLFLSRFWAFLGERSSKTPHKKIKKNPPLVLFWPLTHPPTTGVTDFFLGGPLQRAKGRKGRRRP
jgi:hypothetical protein